LCAFHALDSGGELCLFLGDAQGSNGDFRQAQGRFFQGDVQGAQPGGYGYLFRGIADVGYYQNSFLFGQLDGKFTIQVGHASIVRPFYQKIGTDDRLAFGGIAHGTAQDTLRVGIGLQEQEGPQKKPYAL
jgi:hypothetical protein